MDDLYNIGAALESLSQDLKDTPTDSASPTESPRRRKKGDPTKRKKVKVTLEYLEEKRAELKKLKVDIDRQQNASLKVLQLKRKEMSEKEEGLKMYEKQIEKEKQNLNLLETLLRQEAVDLTTSRRRLE